MKDKKNVNLLLAYYNTNHKLPNKNEKYKGVDISRFVKEIKNGEIELSQDELIQLKDIGISSNKRKAIVHKKVLLLTEFFKEFGRWPQAKEVYKDVKIGYFFYNIRSNITTISNSDKKLLNTLNFPFNYHSKKDSIHKKVLLLTEFFEKFRRWPKAKEVYKDIKIGNFFNSIRYNTTTISNSDKELLKNLSFPFNCNLKEDYVHKKVILLTDFFKEFGRWPKHKEVYNDVKIGRFFNNIRTNITTISDSDEELLKTLKFPFNCNLKKDYVHKKVLLLTEFFEEFGRWPKYKEVYKDVKIGNFFNSIRFNNTTICNSDKELLNNLKFPFTKKQTD